MDWSLDQASQDRWCNSEVLTDVNLCGAYYTWRNILSLQVTRARDDLRYTARQVLLASYGHYAYTTVPVCHSSTAEGRRTRHYRWLRQLSAAGPLELLAMNILGYYQRQNPTIST